MAPALTFEQQTLTSTPHFPPQLHTTPAEQHHLESVMSVLDQTPLRRIGFRPYGQTSTTRTQIPPPQCPSVEDPEHDSLGLPNASFGDHVKAVELGFFLGGRRGERTLIRVWATLDTADRSSKTWVFYVRITSAYCPH